MNCPKCGATVRETDKFCSECGSTLDAKKSDGPCRACGQMVPLGAKFCGNCGASEPHSVPAGATGETVVARAPLRPTEETLAAEPEPEPPSDVKVMTEGVVPPATDDADTGVFRRMIEEELEATINTRTLRQVRRGSGAPSQVQPDPTQEHHVGKPVGFAFGGKGSTRTTKDEAAERAARSTRPSKAKPKPTTKSTAVAAGPKRPVGLAKTPKRPKPAATGDKLRATEDEDAPTEVVDVAPLREPSPVEEVDVDVDVDLDDDDDDAGGDADAGVDEDDGGDIWPDITEEVAEVRFYLLQGLEDDAKVALAQLKEKHGMHPELAVIQAELDGESPPQRKKRKKAPASAKHLDKGAAVERIEIGGIPALEEVPRVDTAVAPPPTSPASRGDTVVAAYVPVEPPLMDDGPESAPTIARIAKVQEGAPPKGRGAPTMKGEAVDEGATTTGRRSRSKEAAPPGRARTGKDASAPPSGRTGTTAPDESLPASAPAVPEMEISVEIQARPGPSRTGATVPMDKLPSDAPASAEPPKPAEPPKSSRPSKITSLRDSVGPPPPPTTTPRSTPSVPPLRKPPTRPMTEPPSAKSSKKKSVPPPPMPVVPSAPSTSDDATEVSGDIEVPRGDTVVAAYPPEPPADLAKDEPSLVDSSDRTVVSRAPQPPAPFSGTPPTSTRNTVVPTTKEGPPPPAPFGGEAPPGGTLVPGTTPPAGGFADIDDASSAVARHVAPSGTPPMPMAEPKPGSEAEAAANTPEPEPEPEPRNETVIARAPQAPAPFQGEAPVTLAPAQTIRLVMLGSRGQTVAERTIRPGDSLDVGRDPAEPWGDDEYLEERHARITPAAGGGVLVDDYDGSGPVFRQVSERTRIRAGDQLRVGQSLIHYDNGDGTGWGQLLIYTNGAEPPKVHPLGGSGAKVGRENGEITFANDTYVSGEHCRFLCEGTSVFIEDLDSSNGTYVRVRKGEPVELGSLLLLGHTQFRIRPA